MTRRFVLIFLVLSFVLMPVKATPIRWVDFQVEYASLQYAMDIDIKTAEQEKHISWIDILSVAACRTGGKCGLPSVKQAAKELRGDQSPEDLLGKLYQYYNYYHTAFEAILGGMLGNFAIEKDGEMIPVYGLKAFSPIAAGYGYSHCSDFGNSRSFGFARKHLGDRKSVV